jgi:nicotinate-nucleotide adenylyltransferase
VLNYLKKKNIRIGILGGTFDPAHKGHLVISRIAKKKIKLNYIIWSITQKNPFKKQPKIDIEKRIKISKKITKKDRFIKIEFLEHKINSKKTIDLIRFLKKINTTLDIFFIMGADNLIKFHKWNRWKEIVKLAKILVFDRQGYKSKSLNSIAAKKMHKNRWKFIKLKKVNISSSQIRKI